MLLTEDHLRLKLLMFVMELEYRARHHEHYPNCRSIPDPEGGICHQMQYLGFHGGGTEFRKALWMLFDYFGSWVHDLRDPSNSYPIPYYISVEQGYWKGRALSMRKSLLSHVRTQIEKDLAHLGPIVHQEQVLWALRAILADSQDIERGVLNPTYGICNQLVTRGISNAARIVCGAAVRWPGTCSPRVFHDFPVDPPDTSNKWQGENLARRQSLIRYCIKIYRDRLRRSYLAYAKKR